VFKQSLAFGFGVEVASFWEDLLQVSAISSQNASASPLPSGGLESERDSPF